MRHIFSLLFIVCLTVKHGACLTLHQRDVPAVVSLDIKRSIISDPVARDRVRRKRDKTIGQTLDNEVSKAPPEVDFLVHIYSHPGNSVLLQRDSRHP